MIAMELNTNLGDGKLFCDSAEAFVDDVMGQPGDRDPE